MPPPLRGWPISMGLKSDSDSINKRLELGAATRTIDVGVARRTLENDSQSARSFYYSPNLQAQWLLKKCIQE